MTRPDSFDDLDDERPLLLSTPDPIAPEFTLRACLAGLGIGTLICTSNTYFGLQTGWISMMSLPSSLLGYGIFKLLNPALPFTIHENVLVQTIAVASGTMPLAAGLVGVIPAIETLLTAEDGGPYSLSLIDLLIWSAGVAFFGVFFTNLLRRQVLVREKLTFPSGTATAEMIRILHVKGDDTLPYAVKMKVLFGAFSLASLVTFFMALFPTLRRIPVFDIMTGFTFELSARWYLDFQPSLAYVGQGMIMGLNTTLSMLLGAMIGWCILSPIAKTSGWAPGDVGDFNDGARGWLIWISLAIMLTDSIVSLLVVTTRWILLRTSQHEEIDHEDVFPGHWTIYGIIGSTILCIVSIMVVFPVVPVFLTILSIILAMFLSILGVRALGETDLNPVSGIGKISQLIFAIIAPKSPSSVLINIVAGGIAEAGAQQSGDLMQDLKTGILIGSSPRVQTYGQVIGSIWSVVLSVLIYRMYTSIYTIPSDIFAIPTAFQWIDCARLVNGHGLPPHVPEFAIGLSMIFGIISFLKTTGMKWLPSGLAVAVGMYNTPNFTLARVLGGVAGSIYTTYARPERRVLGVICASGFILGEGVLGSVMMLLLSLFSQKH